MLALLLAAIGGCPMFPPDSHWNTPVDKLPVDRMSAAYVESIGADKPLHPDFGAGLYQGRPMGIPYVVVPKDQPGVKVRFEYDNQSDHALYPVPKDAPIEGGPESRGDRHILIVQRETCKLYEIFAAYPEGDGWKAGSGAIFDLRSHALRPSGWTSADAAGLPILPGLMRYGDIAAGEITHAVRFTVRRTRREFVWPARHFASRHETPEFPPMGQRFRLRADFDISGFSKENQIILRGLKTYGMILADNGGDWFANGVGDDRWNNADLQQLRRVKGRDFEAVDARPLMIERDSGRAAAAVTR